MYLDNNNNFYGKIDGKSINEFVKFDYKINSCEGRIKHIQDVLEMYEIDGVEFYHPYFDKVYDQERKVGKIDIVINTKKSQYTESNVCRSLEMLADYILNADKEREDINYKIYTSEELFSRKCKEHNLINDIAKANGGKSMIDFVNKGEEFPIFQLPKNYNKVKDLKFKNSDLVKYPPMKDYYDFYEYLKEEVNKLWGKKGLGFEEMKRRGLIKKVMPEVKKDMMLVKQQMMQPIIWKAPLKDSGCPDWDELDMFDKNQVRELLRVHKGDDLQDDLCCILADLEDILSRIDFNEQQLRILDLWRKGFILEDIEIIMGIRNPTIIGILNTIINKIVLQYEEDYSYWYYLNISKGEYKKCSKCGEVKLISYFDKNGSRGLYPSCKICRKK